MQRAALVIAIGVHLLVRLTVWEVALVRDVGLFAYSGWRLTEGAVLYRDLPGMKWPMVYYLLAGGFQLFGPTEFVVKTLGAAFGFFGILAFAGLARDLLGKRGSAVALVVFGLSSAHPSVQGGTSQMEVFMTPFLILSTWLAWRGSTQGRLRDWLGSGLALGLAVSCKQAAATNLIVTFVLVLVAARRSEETPWRTCVAALSLVGAGTALPVGAWIALLGAQGSLGDAFFWTVSFIGGYSAASWDLGAVWRGVRTTLGIAAGNPLPWIGGASFVFGCFRRRDCSPGAVLILTWLVASALGVAFPSKFFRHYYLQLVPALCLAAGWEYRRLSGWMALLKADRRRLRFGMLGMLGFLVALGCNGPVTDAVRGPGRTCFVRAGTWKFHEARLLGRHLREVAGDDATLFVWGEEPGLYFYARKRAPLRDFPLVLYRWHVPEDAWETGIERLRDDPPTFIVRSLFFAQGRTERSLEDGTNRLPPPLPPEPRPWAEVRRGFKQATHSDHRRQAFFAGLGKLVVEGYEPVLTLNEYALYRRQDATPSRLLRLPPGDEAGE